MNRKLRKIYKEVMNELENQINFWWMNNYIIWNEKKVFNRNEWIHLLNK